MVRTLTVLFAGAAIGAAATYLLLPPQAPVAEPAAPLGEPRARASRTSVGGGSPEPPTADTSHAAGLTIAEESSWYALAARSNARELRAAIRDAAGGQASEAQRFALSVLYVRLVEITAGEAIDALALVDASPHGAEIALGVLQRVGIDADNVARVLSAAPGIDAHAFSIEAAAAAAATAPADAIAIALDIDDALAQARAIRRIARSWALSDPRTAIVRGQGLVPAALVAEFREALLDTWSREMPESMLDYLGEGGLSQQEQLDHGRRAAAAVARREPRRVLELAESWPGGLRDIARQEAMQRWAEASPAEALAYLETLPPGRPRDQMQVAYATGYARVDPQRALTWARNEIPASRQPSVVHSVLSGVAQSDPERALDLALSLDGPAAAASLSSVVGSLLTNRTPDRNLIQRILDMPDDPARESALRSVASYWSLQDPRAALDWMLTNNERLGPSAFAQVAEMVSQRDPQLAAGYAQQVPPEARNAWITAVARGYAQQDPHNALSWIAQYRGDPVYEAAAMGVLSHAAQYDPDAAARLLDGIGAANPARRGAVSMVAQQWARQDRNAARSWVMSQPRGETRDSALSALISADPSTGMPDTALLDAFSTDTARQRALFGPILQTAQSDRDRARALAEEHLADPMLRQQAERMISSPGSARQPIIVNGVSAAGLSSTLEVVRRSPGGFFSPVPEPPPAASEGGAGQ